MKKIYLFLAGLSLLAACNSNPGESGAVNDGIKAVDSNGAFQDTVKMKADPRTDTAIGEHREELEKRDSSNNPIKY
jgi:hypothetical protein